MNRIETAQDIVSNFLYKVKSVEVENRPFTVKIKFERGKCMRITGKLAADIIKAKEN